MAKATLHCVKYMDVAISVLLRYVQ